MIATLSTKALHALLTVTALSVFSSTSNNNGMIVSAAHTRKLGKSSKATKSPKTSKSPKAASTCDKKEKLVEVKINTDFYAYETSWEISDACSGNIVESGDFTAEQGYFEWISNDLCLLEKGRYKFKILDSFGDGMYFSSEPFDYSLQYDGQLLAETNDFKGGGFATYFGEESCCKKGEKLVEFKINTDKYANETSWEILDACSDDIVKSGDFGDNYYEYYYQSANEVCVDENGSYTIKISDSYGDGIGFDDYYFYGPDLFEFDYSVRFDGDLVVKETNFTDSSDEVPFGKSSSSCKTPKASKASKNKNTRRLRNKQSKE